MSKAGSKSSMRADVKYVREMLRQIEAAIKTNDYATVIDRCNEASCAAAQIMQEASDVSGLAMP